MAEIDIRIEGLSEFVESKADPDDRLREIQTQAPVSRSGDLWQSGHHRIFCGSACDPASFSLLMQGGFAHVAFTDPPYNVPIDGHASGKGKIRHRNFKMAVGEMDRPEYVSFLSQCCGLMAQHSENGAIHFVCIDWRNVDALLEAGSDAYSELKNICVWIKNNGGMGSLYRSAHEFVCVFKNGTGKHRNNVELGRHGRNRTNVWQYPGMSGFGGRSDEGNLLALHPTVKPIAMIADALLDCSARGDIVLDPFLGSGSTLIAAERIGRICYGMELDPLYVDTAIRRWQRYSGDTAVHVATGMRFDEIASKRCNTHED